MKNIFKMIFVIILFCCLFSLTGCIYKKSSEKLSIVATNFPCYDFARSIIKDSKSVNLKMLLKPGVESHDFEPTPQDIIDIKNSDIFIYVGGESDEWLEDILDDVDKKKTKVIKLLDLVDVSFEEYVEGMEEEYDDEKEYDEHVWTSLINTIKIIDKLKDEIIKIDSSNKIEYEKRASEYIDRLYKIDAEIRDIIDKSKRKEIIFGDRFPLLYFVKEYGLTYYAAFPGCSSETEASAKTISFLIDKVKDDKIPVVFHIELSSSKIAKTIANETGAKVLEFNSAHNISQEDFDDGKTYLDIMEDNVRALKIALN